MNMARLLSTWLAGCVAATLLAPCPMALGSKRHAICVGVDDCPEFRLPSGQRARPLRGAESDARNMADLLVEKFEFPRENVRLLLGPEATYGQLRQALDDVAARCRVGDSVVFYFAGHGSQVPDQRPLDEPDGLDEVLCCHDLTAEGSNAFRDDELGDWLDTLTASSITVVLDCCHSGTGTKDPLDDLAARFLPLAGAARVAADKTSWRELRPTEKSLRNPQRRTALFACRSEQQAYERRFASQTPPVHSGQFTWYLLEGCRGAADANRDGHCTAGEVRAFISDQLAAFNRDRREAGERQEPQLELIGGDGPLFGGP